MRTTCALSTGSTPGIAQVDQVRLGVGRGAVVRRGAGEDLRLRRQLRVDLQPDDGFPAAHAYPRGTRVCQSVARWKACAAAEHARLAEVRADDLQADGQLIDEAAGHRGRRQPGEVGTDGVDVVQVHGHRVRGLGADGERRRRRRRPDQHVDALEGADEVRVDQLPHALRLEVIGIVVAGREHVGPGHDAPLHLRPEPLAARAAVQVLQVARILAAVPEAHAVKARQVRGALGRGHHVVHRHRQRQVRQAHLGEHRAQALVHPQRLAHALLVLQASRPLSKNSLRSPTFRPASGCSRAAT